MGQPFYLFDKPGINLNGSALHRIATFKLSAHTSHWRRISWNTNTPRLRGNVEEKDSSGGKIVAKRTIGGRWIEMERCRTAISDAAFKSGDVAGVQGRAGGTDEGEKGCGG